MSEARSHLKFACRIYKLQDEAGRAFVHEHPRKARSWEEPEIKQLLEVKGVVRVDLDMCRFNLRSTDALDKERLVLKPTSLLTNSEAIAKHMSRKCCGGHNHTHLIGGQRATSAATYTQEFCEGLVEGYKLHIRAIRKQRRGSSGSSKCKQNGSLYSREGLDSDLHYIELDASDPEDLPTIDELVDTLYPNGSRLR